MYHSCSVAVVTGEVDMHVCTLSHHYMHTASKEKRVNIKKRKQNACEDQLVW